LGIIRKAISAAIFSAAILAFDRKKSARLHDRFLSSRQRNAFSLPCTLGIPRCLSPLELSAANASPRRFPLGVNLLAGLREVSEWAEGTSWH